MTIIYIKGAREGHGKRSQLWLQAFRVPAGREEELAEGIAVIDELGADSVFAWPYRAGEGSILESGDARAAWDAIGRGYRGAAG